ncbi:uncharacterized protein DMENIID0001_048450 [Sergentomyia squamirostris]
MSTTSSNSENSDEQLTPIAEKQPTAFQFLQDLYKLMGFRDKIIWDAYNFNQKNQLRDKVMYALGAKKEPEGTDKDSVKKHEREMALLDEISDKIWNQAKYNGGMLLMSVSYICVIPEGGTVTLANAVDCKNYIIMPLFRIKKCKKNDDSSSDCCMIFVDMQARVYANWEAFRDENILPASIVVAPKKGVFSGTQTLSIDSSFDSSDSDSEKDNEHWIVNIEKFLSPAAQSAAKTVGRVDTASSVTGLASSVVLAGAVFPLTAPFVAPVVGVAAIAGLCSGGWSVFRSGQNLHDRRKHEQSNSLGNREARGSWLGVFGGGLGIAAGAAGGLLGSLARNGRTISPFIMVGVDGLNISTLVVNGAGTVNGVVDIVFLDNESISKMQVIQLATSIFFFTHSAYNFKMAKNIVKTHQDMSIKEMKSNLSRNQKRMFDKMSKETIRLKGESAGKSDIIRSMKTISEPKKYFRDLYKVNKQLNQAEVKPSFGRDGKIVLNSAPSEATPSEIRSQLKAQPPNQVFQDIPKYDPNIGESSKPAKLNINSQPHIETLPLTRKSMVDAIMIIKGVAHLITDDIEETLANIAKQLNELTFESFIQYSRSFVDEFGTIIERDIKRLISFDEYVETLFLIITKKANEIKVSINEFIDKYLSSRAQKKDVDNAMLTYYRAQKPTVQCNVCQGFYCQ